jgi:hypothetical protein
MSGAMQARKAHGVAAAAHQAADPVHQLVTLAERLGRTAAVARALVLAGRTVDLTGIEDGIGLLCAKSLDLPREQARDILPALHALLAQLSSLTSAIQMPAPAADGEP